MRSVRAFVAAHDELEEILGGRGRELLHPEVVDDEQRHRGELGHLLRARPVDACLREFVEEAVGLGIADVTAR